MTTMAMSFVSLALWKPSRVLARRANLARFIVIYEFVLSHLGALIIGLVVSPPQAALAALKPTPPKIARNQLALPEGVIPGKVIERGPKKEKKIALTIDDGPSDYTGELLDLLKAKGVHATFFFIGIHTKDHKQIIRRVLDEGHEVGNHSWNHPVLSKMRLAAQTKQIDSMQDRLTEITDLTPHWFRPPYGALNRNTIVAAKARGCAVVMWSIDPRDWSSNSSRAGILKSCLKAKAGDVVLLHEKERTLGLLGELIEGWKKKNLVVGSLGELFTPSAPVEPKPPSAPAAAGGLNPAIKPPWQKK